MSKGRALVGVLGAVCSYGCGGAARYVLKNGRLLCAEFVSQCPSIRHRNSVAHKGRAPFVGESHPRPLKGKPAWNRGLNYEDAYGATKAEVLRAAARIGGRKGQLALQSSHRETLRRQKLSEHARLRGLGGYQPGSGRGKKGWCRGVWCDSSYELAFVVYASDHGIAFERNREAFPYTFEGKAGRWIPDFRLGQGTYVEIKGYVTERARAKFANFPHPLHVMGSREMSEILEYVVARYGRNFVALYE